MGNYITNKAILLDERDFGDAPHPTMETLSATIHDYLLDEFELEPAYDDDSGCPSLELIGVASERYGATCMLYDGYGEPRSTWVTQDGGFRSALMAEYRHHDFPDPEALFRADAGATEALELQVQRRICEHVMAGSYRSAEHLISVVAGIQRTGLPLIRSRWAFDERGDEEIYDYREANHGPGSRILAEIAFNWGQ